MRQRVFCGANDQASFVSIGLALLLALSLALVSEKEFMRDQRVIKRDQLHFAHSDVLRDGANVIFEVNYLVGKAGLMVFPVISKFVVDTSTNDWSGNWLTRRVGRPKCHRGWRTLLTRKNNGRVCAANHTISSFSDSAGLLLQFLRGIRSSGVEVSNKCVHPYSGCGRVTNVTKRHWNVEADLLANGIHVNHESYVGVNPGPIRILGNLIGISSLIHGLSGQFDLLEARDEKESSHYECQRFKRYFDPLKFLGFLVKCIGLGAIGFICSYRGIWNFKFSDNAAWRSPGPAAIVSICWIVPTISNLIRDFVEHIGSQRNSHRLSSVLLLFRGKSEKSFRVFRDVPAPAVARASDPRMVSVGIRKRVDYLNTLKWLVPQRTSTKNCLETRILPQQQVTGLACCHGFE